MLARSEADVDFEPDYAKPVGEVYRDVAVAYIQERRALEILRLGGMRAKESGTTRWLPDWAVPTQLQDWVRPSWVPDWSVPRAGHDLPYVYATGGAFGESRYDGADTLEVTGVALGTVSVMEPILPLDAAPTNERNARHHAKVGTAVFPRPSLHCGRQPGRRLPAYVLLQLV